VTQLSDTRYSASGITPEKLQNSFISIKLETINETKMQFSKYERISFVGCWLVGRLVGVF